MEQHAVVVVDQQTLDSLANKSTIQGSGVTALLFTLVYGVLWLRKRLSNDKLDVDKNRAEGNLLEVVIAERNAAIVDAREAWARRAHDAELIGKLSAQVEALNQLNHKTNNEVHLLRLLNERQGAEIKALREEFAAVREQLKTCATCPLRKMQDETHT